MLFPTGPRLRAARRAAGLTAERLALEVGRSVYSIHAYEQGKVRPPVDVLMRIAAVLGTSVDALLDTTEIRHDAA